MVEPFSTSSRLGCLGATVAFLATSLAFDNPYIFTAGAILALVATLAWTISSISKKTAVAVYVYPLGVQMQTTHTNENSKLIGKATFIPKDQVIDCVVVERILAYRVCSELLFRVKRRGKGHRLLLAFPGVDLSYKECLCLRLQIAQAMQTMKQE
jgi:hypothetical protein